MSKITYAEFRKKILDLDVPDSEIRKYLTVDPEYSGAFNPRFVTDRDKVTISDEELELESAMGFGNAICRWRRHGRFERAIDRGDQRPVLVAEGDSWFQFPFLIDEVIDQLEEDYLIWSLGAAGDTAANMTGINSEYMRGLKKWADRVKGFLFSAAGNDVIGEDDSGDPALEKLLKPYEAGQNPAWHVNRAAFNKTLDFLRTAYQKVIRNIRNDSRFTALPIFVHGYDYPFPYPFNDNDTRDPIYADSDEWLGKPFEKLGFPNGAFRQEVLKVMIDALYNMLFDLAASDDRGHVHVVDARGSLPTLDLWADEIHGTDAGFKKVAQRFQSAISSAISPDTS